MENETKYTVKEACQMLGITRRVLISLCNSGLIPSVRRNHLRQRIFSDQQLTHARIILGLRQTGMNKAELKRYVNLIRRGRSTLPQQKALFETQKRQLWQNLEDIQQGIDFLERQIELIDRQMQQGKPPKFHK